MPAAGDPVYANDVLRARPKIENDIATGLLAAGLTNTDVPGISISFTTETVGAELTLIWFAQFKLTGASTAQASARPSVTGPAGFTYAAPVYAVAGQEVSTDSASTGNSHKTTLGLAGTYTITLKGTTPANVTIQIYSSITAIIQEQWT